ncbi:MAG: hypothetical protein IEMM0002_0218 [bacterium]|nr:MAG: hypothetical protein IEMM0002_0218 [bacterium]
MDTMYIRNTLMFRPWNIYRICQSLKRYRHFIREYLTQYAVSPVSWFDKLTMTGTCHPELVEGHFNGHHDKR